MKKDFPEGFLWGAATSSHQIEGGNKNDWTRWEEAGRVEGNQQSGKAADSWNLYEKDHDALEKLNLNAYRFSIEWSRIEPKKGKFDKAAIEHYRKMLKSLHKRGIEPIVTLHHFTNPLWLEDWSHEENVDYFLRYTEYAVEKLGDLVKYWCTINEPVNMVLLGFEIDIWPPGTHSKIAGLKAFKNFAEAHNKAYELIHKIHIQHRYEEPMVGIPLSVSYFTPRSKWNPLDHIVNFTARRVRNHRFASAIKDHTDFIGINYYFTFHTKFNSVGSYTDIRDPSLPFEKNDLGWNIEPEGLYHLLKEMSVYGVPLMITENGLPDAKDEKREWYIREHLKSVKRAIDDGVNMIGYLHWSLIDNFEWADGYGPRFGLVKVDYKTMKRTIRPSAKVYGKIAKNNSLDGV